MKSHIAIIGAGMAGLAAAEALTKAGCRVTLYEKSRSLGGRMATRRIEGCTLDHGAQNIKPGDTAVTEILQTMLPPGELVAIPLPVCLYSNAGAILPPDAGYNAAPKYTCRSGITALPKSIVKNMPEELVEIRFNTRVHRFEETNAGVLLRDEEGNEVGKAAAVVLTAPLPQAATLLAESALTMHSIQETLDRVKLLRSVEYNSCITVLLGYASPMPPPPAYALLAEDRSACLLWLAFENAKAPERAPNGETLLIAQFGPLFSSLCYEEEEGMLISRTLTELQTLFGSLYDRPAWAQVKKWRYSQPRARVWFEEASFQGMNSLVYLAGDGLRPGGGRIQEAYLSGKEAAAAILERIA